MGYKIGASTPLGSGDTTQTRCGVDPRATYSPGGERVQQLNGVQAFVGYPRATWTFKALTVAQFETLRSLLSGYSGACYVETRNAADAFTEYSAIVTLPDPGSLNRWGEKYRDVMLEIVLLEAM